MKRRASNRTGWRIGELARATGLTVRTLHHYEKIGLLAPPSRTGGHQRVYDEHDVRRLYRICALRDLGLPLADIGRMLEDGHGGLGDVLRAHRARVEVELQRLTSLRTLLDHACTHANRDLKAEDVLATIEAMSRVARRSTARRSEGNAPKDAERAWLASIETTEAAHAERTDRKKRRSGSRRHRLGRER
jgi:DNA-binding transcriptional MerR regulator